MLLFAWEVTYNIIVLSFSAWADQRSHPGDIIVINQLITTYNISLPKNFKIKILTHSYLATVVFIHPNIFYDKRSSISEQALWAITDEVI